MTAKNTAVIFGKILATVDGSGLAEIAGYTAADLAKKYSASLAILYVAKYPKNLLGVSSSHTVEVGLPLSDPLADRLKQEASASMNRIGEYARNLDVEANQEIIDTSSSIVGTIMDYVYRNNVDLIVMGSRGTNTFKTELIGSVSEGIFQGARCAVMIVRRTF